MASRWHHISEVVDGDQPHVPATCAVGSTSPGSGPEPQNRSRQHEPMESLGGL